MALTFTPNPRASNIIVMPTQRKLNAAFKPYAVELGKLVYAWNRLHERLAGLFVLVTGIQELGVATGIWYSTPSDLSQRKMLRAAVAAKNFKNPNAKKEIIWVLDTIDHTLSSHRNRAIHAPFVLNVDADGISLRTDLFSENPHAKHLWRKDLKNEFIWYRRMADVLAWYAYDLHHGMVLPERNPWPDRPSLPTLGQKRDPVRKARRRSRLLGRRLQLRSVSR